MPSRHRDTKDFKQSAADPPANPNNQNTTHETNAPLHLTSQRNAEHFKNNSLLRESNGAKASETLPFPAERRLRSRKWSTLQRNLRAAPARIPPGHGSEVAKTRAKFASSKKMTGIDRPRVVNIVPIHSSPVPPQLKSVCQKFEYSDLVRRSRAPTQPPCN